MINTAWINDVRTRYNSFYRSILSHPDTIEDDPNNNNYPKNWFSKNGRFRFLFTLGVIHKINCKNWIDYKSNY